MIKETQKQIERKKNVFYSGNDTSWIMAAATAYVTPVQTSSACKLLVSTCYEEWHLNVIRPGRHEALRTSWQ